MRARTYSHFPLLYPQTRRRVSTPSREVRRPHLAPSVSACNFGYASYRSLSGPPKFGLFVAVPRPHRTLSVERAASL
jgi:hypothetical protein